MNRYPPLKPPDASILKAISDIAKAAFTDADSYLACAAAASADTSQHPA